MEFPNCIKFIPNPFILYKKNDNRIYLTFDDGPTEITRTIIDILQKFRIHATFFMEGHKASQHPDIVSSVVSHGHSIGYHTYKHINLKKTSFKYLSVLYREIILFYNEFCPLTPLRMLRPPYGKFSLKMLLFFYIKNIKVIMWSIDSGDSNNFSRKYVLENLSPKNVRNGDIILMHDDQEYTAYILPEIISNLHKYGFIFGKIV